MNGKIIAAIAAPFLIVLIGLIVWRQDWFRGDPLAGRTTASWKSARSLAETGAKQLETARGHAASQEHRATIDATSRVIESLESAGRLGYRTAGTMTNEAEAHALRGRAAARLAIVEGSGGTLVARVYPFWPTLHDLAVADLSEAAAIDASPYPDRAELTDALVARAAARATRGMIHGALADLDRARSMPGEAAVESSEARLLRGRCLFDLGDLTGAITEFDAVLESDRDLAEALRRRGLALLMQGETVPDSFDRAAEDFQAAIALEAIPDDHLNLGFALRGMGQAAAAIEAFSSAIDRYAANNLNAAEAHVYRGLTRQESSPPRETPAQTIERLTEALDDLESGLALYPAAEIAGLPRWTIEFYIAGCQTILRMAGGDVSDQRFDESLVAAIRSFPLDAGDKASLEQLVALHDARAQLPGPDSADSSRSATERRIVDLLDRVIADPADRQAAADLTLILGFNADATVREQRHALALLVWLFDLDR